MNWFARVLNDAWPIYTVEIVSSVTGRVRPALLDAKDFDGTYDKVTHRMLFGREDQAVHYARCRNIHRRPKDKWVATVKRV